MAIDLQNLVVLQQLNYLQNISFSNSNNLNTPFYTNPQLQIPNKLICSYKHQPRDKTQFTCMKFFASGQKLATGLQQGEVIIVQTKSFQKDPLSKIFKHDDTIRAICLINQDSTLIIGDKNGNIKYIDQNQMREQMIKVEKKSMESIKEISASQSSQKFLTCADKSIWIWDTETAKPETYLEGAGNNITYSEWNPVHCLLISSSKDLAQAVKLWDPRTGSEIHTVQKQNLEISIKGMQTRLGLVPVVTTSRVFPGIRPQKYLILEDQITFFRISKLTEVNCVGWKPNCETTLAAGDEQGNIYIYDTCYQSQISCLQKENHQAIFDLQWSQDGITLATLGNDKKIDFWAQAQQQDFVLKFEEDQDGITEIQRKIIHKYI